MSNYELINIIQKYESSNQKYISEKVKELIKNYRYRNNEIAELLKISVESLNGRLYRNINFSLKELAVLSELFSKNIEYFLD